MAEKKINTYCKICGKGYYICNACSKQTTLRSWRTVTDNREHYKIYLTLHGYTVSQDKTQAKMQLQNCDLSGLENFKPEIQAAIKKIMAE